MSQCKVCKSIDHEMTLYKDICGQCLEAIITIAQGGQPALKELIEQGWRCITPADELRERNYKDDKIDALEQQVRSLQNQLGECKTENTILKRRKV